MYAMLELIDQRKSKLGHAGNIVNAIVKTEKTLTNSSISLNPTLL